MVLLASVTVGAGVAPSRAEAQDVPPRVEVIGDSLTRTTYEAVAGWTIRAEDGRAMFRARALIRRIVDLEPDVLVLALGSNDVSSRRTAAQMRRTIDGVRADVDEVPCVIYTTVKVVGVTLWYHPRWPQAAARWNRILATRELEVADWDAAATGHPELVLADGLHLTDEGTVAYDALLREAVASSCGSAPI